MDFFSNIGKDIKGFFSGDQQGPEVESAGPFLSHGGIYQATIRRPDSLHITAWGPNGAHFEGNWKQSAELGRLFQAIKTGQAELHLQNVRCNVILLRYSARSWFLMQKTCAQRRLFVCLFF
jgi:hypothetical protein